MNHPVLLTSPTGCSDAKFAALMGVRAKDVDMWSPSFIAQIDLVTRAVPDMTNAELAQALTWAQEHSCYYHPELSDLLEATVAEAARRLMKS